MIMFESFLISLIANFVTIGGQIAIKNMIQNKSLETEIRKAFNNALKKWTINNNILGKEEIYINQKLKLLIDCVKEPTKITNLDKNTSQLINYFKLELQKNQITWNFIMDTHFQNEINKLNSIEDAILDIQELLNQTELSKRELKKVRVEKKYDANLVNQLVKESTQLYSEGNILKSFEKISIAYNLAPYNSKVVERYATVLFRNAEFEEIAKIIGEYEETGKEEDVCITRVKGEYYRRIKEYEKSNEVLRKSNFETEYNIAYLIGINYLFLYGQNHDNINLFKAKQFFEKANNLFQDLWHIKLNLAIVHRLIDKTNPNLTLEKETISLLNAKINLHPQKVSAKLYRLLYYVLVDNFEKFEKYINNDKKRLSKNYLLTIDFIDSAKERINLIHKDEYTRNKYILGFVRWSNYFSLNY